MTSLNTALHVTVAEAPRRIGKALFWCPADSTDGVWREDLDAPGVWRKPSAINSGKDAYVHQKYDFFRLDGENSIAFRHMLRQDLARSNNRALIMGELSDEVSLSETRNAWKTLLSMPRNQTLLKDAPRSWLTLDCDNLDLRLHDRDIDVVAQDGELPDMLADILDRAGLDFLIADCVMHLSSTHGYLDRHTFKAHLEWHLEEPLTLKQQRHVAEFINSRTEAAGFSRLLDTSIYESSRLLFTAPPHLQRRVWHPGKGIVSEPAFGPSVQRVRLITRGQPSIRIPDEAHIPPAIERFKTIAKTPRATPTDIDAQLKPGNVYMAVRARVYAVAQKTPSHRAETELERLRVQLARDIAKLPDNDDATFERRLRHIAPAELRRSWDTAIAKRRNILDAIPMPQKARHAPAEARAVLERTATSFVKEALERAAGREAASLSEDLSVDPPRPLHLLLKTPPGVGKTHAALRAVLPQHMTTQRISYLSPTVRLSAEAIERKLTTLEGDYLRSRARHHKGRKHLCKSKEYGALADRLEELGRSPVKEVCGRCPIRDACAWPAQQSDNESGLVAGQHAHATTSLARLSEQAKNMPAFGIVDESLISTILQETQQQRSIAALRRITAKTVVRSKEGSVVISATNDVRGYRSQVLDALAASKQRLSRSAVLSLAGEIVIRRGEGQRLTTRIEDAIDTEQYTSRGYDRAFRQALEGYHEAKITQQSTTKYERQMSTASNQIKTSRFFQDLYKAIAASLSTTRDTIFGVFVTPRKQVGVHIRATLPQPFQARSWIWLDGTANESVWSAMFSQAPVDLRVLDVPVEPSHYHLTQYPDRAYGKGMFTATANSDNLTRLHRFILHAAARHRPADVLVVCQLPVKNKLLSLKLPSNVRLEHFNNLRGLDRYKHTPCAIIVGRPMPTTSALETLTEALHYDDPAVTSLTRAHKLLHTRRTLSGTPISVQTETHPDARVEALRQQVVDAEVRQAVMRLRLFDRTPASKAEIHVFGQTDTGLAIHDVRDWVDAERLPVEIIAASGVACYQQAVAPCYSQSTITGIEKKWLQRQRERIGQISDRKSLIINEDKIGNALQGSSSIDSNKKGEGEVRGVLNRARPLKCVTHLIWSAKLKDIPHPVEFEVDPARFPDAGAVKAAIELETELHVLSLWEGGASMKPKSSNERVSRYRAAKRAAAGSSHRRRGRPFKTPVDPVSVAGTKLKVTH